MPVTRRTVPLAAATLRARGFVFLSARRADSAVTVLDVATGREAAVDSAAPARPDFDSAPGPGFRR
jgi:hypothetical protein